MYLELAARLEFLSVDAFEILAMELEAHRAPTRLVRAALRASRDEVRHAREMNDHFRSFGGSPIPMRRSVRRRIPRSIEAMARENAVEGCVRETYGALVATWQSRAAANPRLRTTMARIAADERRHASLAWQIAAWADPRLSARARQSVARARKQAARRLGRELTNQVPETVVRVAGMPSAKLGLEMHRHLVATLWAAPQPTGARRGFGRVSTLP
jgi:hypothetical protein